MMANRSDVASISVSSRDVATRPRVNCFISAPRTGTSRTTSDLLVGEDCVTCGDAFFQPSRVHVEGSGATPINDWVEDVSAVVASSLRRGTSVVVCNHGASGTGKTHTLFGSRVCKGESLPPSVFSSIIRHLLGTEDKPFTRVAVGVCEVRPPTKQMAASAASSPSLSLSGGDSLYDLLAGTYIDCTGNDSESGWSNEIDCSTASSISERKSAGFLSCQYRACASENDVSAVLWDAFQRSLSWTCAPKVRAGGQQNSSMSADSTALQAEGEECVVFARSGNGSHIIVQLCVDVEDQYTVCTFFDLAGPQIMAFRATPSADLAYRTHRDIVFHLFCSADVDALPDATLAGRLLLDAVMTSSVVWLAHLRADADYDSINAEVITVGHTLSEQSNCRPLRGRHAAAVEQVFAGAATARQLEEKEGHRTRSYSDSSSTLQPSPPFVGPKRPPSCTHRELLTALESFEAQTAKKNVARGGMDDLHSGLDEISAQMRVVAEQLESRRQARGRGAPDRSPGAISMDTGSDKVRSLEDEEPIHDDIYGSESSPKPITLERCGVRTNAPSSEAGLLATDEFAAHAVPPATESTANVAKGEASIEMVKDSVSWTGTLMESNTTSAPPGATPAVQPAATPAVQPAATPAVQGGANAASRSDARIKRLFEKANAKPWQSNLREGATGIRQTRARRPSKVTRRASSAPRRTAPHTQAPTSNDSPQKSHFDFALQSESKVLPNERLVRDTTPPVPPTSNEEVESLRHECSRLKSELHSARQETNLARDVSAAVSLCQQQYANMKAELLAQHEQDKQLIESMSLNQSLLIAEPDSKMRRIRQLELELRKANSQLFEMRRKADERDNRRAEAFQCVLAKAGECYKKLQHQCKCALSRCETMEASLKEERETGAGLRDVVDAAHKRESAHVEWIAQLRNDNNALMQRVSVEHAEQCIHDLLERCANPAAIRHPAKPIGEEQILNFNSNIDRALSLAADAAYRPILRAINMVETLAEHMSSSRNNSALALQQAVSVCHDGAQSLRVDQQHLVGAVEHLREELLAVQHEVYGAAIRERHYINALLAQPPIASRQAAVGIR